jgi:transcriptional regulator with XRE-family HTH domain
MQVTSLNKIGDRIRVCRVEKKLNQENVACEIGISITAYSKIERGKTNVSIGRLEQIAACLGVPLARLIRPNDIDMTQESGHIYSSDVDKHVLSIRIKNLQEELIRLNKVIAEKNEIIILLKGVITGGMKNSE